MRWLAGSVDFCACDANREFVVALERRGILLVGWLVVLVVVSRGNLTME